MSNIQLSPTQILHLLSPIDEALKLLGYAPEDGNYKKVRLELLRLYSFPMKSYALYIRYLRR